MGEPAGNRANVLKPGTPPTTILNRLAEIAEELIDGHAELALMLNNEREGRVAAWANPTDPQLGKDSVQARDRTATAATIDISNDITELRADIQGWETERDYLTILLQHTYVE